MHINCCGFIKANAKYTLTKNVTPFLEQSSFLEKYLHLLVLKEVLCIKYVNSYLPTDVGGYTNLPRAVHQKMCCYYVSLLKTNCILKDCIIICVQERQSPGTHFWLVAA